MNKKLNVVVKTLINKIKIIEKADHFQTKRSISGLKNPDLQIYIIYLTYRKILCKMELYVFVQSNSLIPGVQQWTP